MNVTVDTIISMQGVSTTIIFPVFNLTRDRIRNFRFNLERACSAAFNSIIVVEQVEVDDGSPSPFDNKVQYIRVVSDSKVIEKSRLVNEGARAAQTDFIWVNDADIYCPFNQVLEAIKPTYVVVKPFKYFLRLEEDETRIFLRDKKITTNANYMDGLCAGSFIIRKNEFVKIRGMDERYKGWGYEDMELALRIKQVYPIDTFIQFRGVHLYHPKETSPEAHQATVDNLQLYAEAKAIVAEDVLDQINQILSPFPKNQDFLVKGGRAVHVVSPALSSPNSQFLHRQLLALNAINKADDRGVIKIAALAQDEFSTSKDEKILEDWKSIQLPRDAKAIGHKKSLPYIRDMLDIARKYAGPADFLVLSNADCGITRTFYRNLLNCSEDYVEYFRVNVTNPTSADDLCTNEHHRTREEKDGIDAFAIRARLYDQYRDHIPELLLGEPYWDPVISGIFKKATEIAQNRSDLRHADHPQEWNLRNLSVGGRLNKEGWLEAYRQGHLDIRKCEVIEDTLVVRMFYKSVDKTRASDAFRNVRLQDQPANQLIIEVGDNESRFSDEDLGTTGGRRVFVTQEQLTAKGGPDGILSSILESSSKYRFIIWLHPYAKAEDTSAIRKVVAALRETPDKVIQGTNGFKTNNEQDSFLLKAMTRTTFKTLREQDESNSEKAVIDTAVIIATFGSDPLRFDANTEAFAQLQKQSLPVHYYWIEVLDKDFGLSLAPSLVQINEKKNVTHIVIRADENNEHIFQKEALWNKVVAQLPPEIKFLFFLDSDIYCDKSNWFSKIREALDFDPMAVIQPGTEVVTLKKRDSHTEITRTQLTYVGFDELKPQKPGFNPGLAICMTRKLFDEIGGFNPYGVMYGGDTLFLIETNRNAHVHYRHLMKHSSMRHVIRRDIINRTDLKITWKGLDNIITHVWHGDETNRVYWVWEHFLTTIDFNSMRWLQIDEQGLLAWKHRYPLFDYVYERKSQLTDKFACSKIIRDFYELQERESNIRTIFAPDNFGVDLWTMNVKREGSEVPFNSDGDDRYIRIQGELKNKNVNGFIAVFSLAPQFASVDVSQIQNACLALEFRVIKNPQQSVWVAIQSKAEDTEKPIESQRYKVATDLVYPSDQVWQTMRIPLSEFQNIIPERLYSIVFKGSGEFIFDIKNLKIES